MEAFINVRVDELNKLNKEQVRDILIDDIDGFIPESEDHSTKTTENLKHFTLIKLSEIVYSLLREVLK